MFVFLSPAAISCRAWPDLSDFCPCYAESSQLERHSMAKTATRSLVGWGVPLAALLAAVPALAGFRHPPQCEGLTCQDEYIMRYNGTCFCQTNPCHGHACEDQTFPHLEFEFSQTGALTCFCTKPCPQGLCAGERKPPQCVQSGHHCPNRAQPILHIDQGECRCKSHPCVVAGRGACDDPALPMLDYHYDEAGKLDCFCRKHPCKSFVCSGHEVVDWDQEGHCFCRSDEDEIPTQTDEL